MADTNKGARTAIGAASFFIFALMAGAPATAQQPATLPDARAVVLSLRAAADDAGARATPVGATSGEATTVATPPLAPFAIRRVSSLFSNRADPFTGAVRFHRGLDLPGAYGTPIRAICGGRVSRAGVVGGYGNLIEIRQAEGMAQRYGHLATMLVAPGEVVRAGDVIALMGSTGRSTGSHLHLETWTNGSAVDPIQFVVSGHGCTPFGSGVAESTAFPFISDFARQRQSTAAGRTGASVGGSAVLLTP